MKTIRCRANDLVQKWADEGMIGTAHFMLADDVERLVRETVRDLCAEAVNLVDVVDGSGGGMLDVEPYASTYANLKDLGAAPSGGNHAKEAEQAGGEEVLAQGEEAVVRDAVAVRADP